MRSVLQPAAGPAGGRGGGARYRSQLPHHRRRRRWALGLVAAALVLVVIAVVLGTEGGRSTHTPPAATPAGFFARIATLAGQGQGSFSAAEQSAENAAVSRTLAYTPYVRIAGARHREMALTFDDGPGPYTLRLLSVLRRHHTPATFFEVGVEERYFSAGTRAIVAAGDPIGDHTELHAALGKLAPGDQESEILEQIAATGTYGAPYPRLFRPPYGSFDSATLTILGQLKLLMVLWTIDTSDYRQPGVPAIVGSVLSGARPGAIVLMHDAGGTRTQTIAALPAIIDGLRARGYRLVTVPRLLLDNPAPADQDISSLAGAGGG